MDMDLNYDQFWVIVWSVFFLFPENAISGNFRHVSFFVDINSQYLVNIWSNLVNINQI